MIVNGKERPWQVWVAAHWLASYADTPVIADLVLASMRRRSDEEVEDLCRRILSSRRIKKHIHADPAKRRRNPSVYPMPEERIEGIT
ncbi:MAG TPA: hypothetical protein P5244_07935 [Syntrophales bacterium]|nr:hypothetical protein [Syntrophales bacterium]